MNFSPLTPEITRLMFTHPKSIVRVLCMLMHLCHVTLLPGKFHPCKFPPSDLGRRADSRWDLPQISSLRILSIIIKLCVQCMQKKKYVKCTQKIHIRTRSPAIVRKSRPCRLRPKPLVDCRHSVIDHNTENAETFGTLNSTARCRRLCAPPPHFPHTEHKFFAILLFAQFSVRLFVAAHS